MHYPVSCFYSNCEKNLSTETIDQIEVQKSKRMSENLLNLVAKARAQFTCRPPG